MSRHESTARITPQVETTRLDQLFDLAGVRVFIPGGYGALGEAIARGFAHHGAAVAIAGPLPNSVQEEN